MLNYLQTISPYFTLYLIRCYPYILCPHISQSTSYDAILTHYVPKYHTLPHTMLSLYSMSPFISLYLILCYPNILCPHISQSTSYYAIPTYYVLIYHTLSHTMLSLHTMSPYITIYLIRSYPYILCPHISQSTSYYAILTYYVPIYHNLPHTMLSLHTMSPYITLYLMLCYRYILCWTVYHGRWSGMWLNIIVSGNLLVWAKNIILYLSYIHCKWTHAHSDSWAWSCWYVYRSCPFITQWFVEFSRMTKLLSVEMGNPTGWVCLKYI